MSRLYVASSWRNERYPAVVGALRDAGIPIYDFRTPRPNDRGFHWTDVWQDIRADGDWRRDAQAADIMQMLEHPIAQAGFDSDMSALRGAVAALMVMPCGRAAHLELGYAVGAGLPTAILLPTGTVMEPELVWRMAGLITYRLDRIVAWARRAVFP